MATKSRAILTGELSKAARRELTLTQNNVLAETKVNVYKLKQFEAGRYTPDLATLKKLRDFYESHGVDLDELEAHAGNKPPEVQRETDAARGITTQGNKPGFLISEALPQEHVDRILDRMDGNDQRIEALIATSYSNGFFGVSEESDAALRELFGTLAEGYLMFRFLQGRNIIDWPKEVTTEPATVSDALSIWVKESPVYEVLANAIKPGKKQADATDADLDEGQD